MRLNHYYTGSASQPATPQSNHLYAADLLTMVPGIVQSTGMEASLPDISSYGSMMPVSSNLNVFDKAIQVVAHEVLMGF